MNIIIIIITENTEGMEIFKKRSLIKKFGGER